jgi:hypothetical protein
MDNIKYYTKDEALSAVAVDGLELEYVIESLKMDKEVVLAAVKQNPQAAWLAEDLFFDKDVILAALQKDESEWESIKEQIGLEDEVIAGTSVKVPAIETTPELTADDKFKELQRLFKIVDPRTGMRYDIPLLDRNSASYFFDYSDRMKLKERDPATFERMLRWD